MKTAFPDSLFFKDLCAGRQGSGPHKRSGASFFALWGQVSSLAPSSPHVGQQVLGPFDSGMFSIAGMFESVGFPRSLWTQTEKDRGFDLICSNLRGSLSCDESKTIQRLSLARSIIRRLQNKTGLCRRRHSMSHMSHPPPSISAESAHCSFGDTRKEGNCSPFQRCGSKDVSAGLGKFPATVPKFIHVRFYCRANGPVWGRG